MFLDEDDVPLCERKKAMILKDTFGIAQHSSKISDATIHGKYPTIRTLFVSDTNIFESILPTSYPYYNTLLTPNPIP